MTPDMIVGVVAVPPLVSTAIIRIAGFALLAGLTAAIAAILYRWYSGAPIPDGIAVLIGVSIVAIWLNTQSALGAAIIGDTSLLEPITAVYTIAAFVASAILADGGRRLGNHLATDMFTLSDTPRSIDEMGELVRTVGRTVLLEIPATIDDADGYDPVAAPVKEAIAGETLHLPRNLSSDQMEERVAERLRRDFGVGYVDVDVTADGALVSLAVGSIPAGIGPSLAPGTVAVALPADPAPDASPGDSIRVWRHDEAGLERVLTGEIRGTAGDVVTLAVGEGAVEKLQPTEEATYRIVTLPGTLDASREFISLLYSTNAAVNRLDVAGDSPLVDRSVASLPVSVLLIERDGTDHPFPRNLQIRPGDSIHALARPSGFEALATLGQSSPSDQ